jgi:hypothetical protein
MPIQTGRNGYQDATEAVGPLVQARSLVDRRAGTLPQGRTNAQVHVLDAGHFALDTKADEVAALGVGS